MKEQKVYIFSDTDQLEGLLTVQEAPSDNRGVIFCHPHPQFGGNMHSLVIETAVEAAAQEGFSTLRFNFRGVGESSGSYGEGVGEREDVKAVTEYLCSKLKDSNPKLILLGYSFGAWTGLPVAVEDGRFVGMVGVAPPLEIYDFEFMRGCKKKKLFISGNRDVFCPVSRLEEWYQQLDLPKSLTVLQGADHFFFTHHRLLIEPLREFLKGIVRSD